MARLIVSTVSGLELKGIRQDCIEEDYPVIPIVIAAGVGYLQLPAMQIAAKLEALGDHLLAFQVVIVVVTYSPITGEIEAGSEPDVVAGGLQQAFGTVHVMHYGEVPAIGRFGGKLGCICAQAVSSLILGKEVVLGLGEVAGVRSRARECDTLGEVVIPQGGIIPMHPVGVLNKAVAVVVAQFYTFEDNAVVQLQVSQIQAAGFECQVVADAAEFLFIFQQVGVDPAAPTEEIGDPFDIYAFASAILQLPLLVYTQAQAGSFLGRTGGDAAEIVKPDILREIRRVVYPHAGSDYMADTADVGTAKITRAIEVEAGIEIGTVIGTTHPGFIVFIPVVPAFIVIQALPEVQPTPQFPVVGQAHPVVDTYIMLSDEAAVYGVDAV